MGGNAEGVEREGINVKYGTQKSELQAIGGLFRSCLMIPTWTTSSQDIIVLSSRVIVMTPGLLQKRAKKQTMGEKDK